MQGSRQSKVVYVKDQTSRYIIKSYHKHGHTCNTLASLNLAIHCCCLDCYNYHCPLCQLVLFVPQYLFVDRDLKNSKIYIKMSIAASTQAADDLQQVAVHRPHRSRCYCRLSALPLTSSPYLYNDEDDRPTREVSFTNSKVTNGINNINTSTDLLSSRHTELSPLRLDDAFAVIVRAAKQPHTTKPVRYIPAKDGNIKFLNHDIVSDAAKFNDNPMNNNIIFRYTQQQGQQSNQTEPDCNSRDKSCSNKRNIKNYYQNFIQQQLLKTTAKLQAYTKQCQIFRSYYHNSKQVSASSISLMWSLLCMLSVLLVTPNVCSALAPTDLATSPNSGPSMCPLVPACSCKWSNGKQGASCERRNLITIPSQLPPDTQILEFTGNNLNTLPHHVFQNKHLTNLQKIYLSECKITLIADEAFAHLTNLIELDLSHNHIQQVPSRALELLSNSLRKLSLAFNPIQVIDSAAFNLLTRLNTLDLSNCNLNQLKANAFHGLNELRELKLHDNKLSQSPMSVMSDLRDYLIIDLYGNQWHCDCELRQAIDWMARHHVQQSIIPTCQTPQRHKDIRWFSIKPEDYMCPPVIISKQNELVVGAGSNVTFACTARGSPPLTFVWFQDEKNLTTSRGGSNGGANGANSLVVDPPPSTKLLDEKRYEIAEELTAPNITTSILYLMNLKLTDTSLFLCWVENAAGYTMANFSLTVNDSPPTRVWADPAATGGDVPTMVDDINGSSPSSLLKSLGIGQDEMQLGILIIGFLIVLIAIIVLFIVYRHGSNSTRNRSIKNSSADLSKIKHVNGHGGVVSGNGVSRLTSSNKFSHSSNILGVDSGEDGTDEDGDSDGTLNAGGASGGSLDDMGSAASSSDGSCKKPKGALHDGTKQQILAVNNLDGFIQHLRSGIINMDYHSMSPVIQFNNTLKPNNNNQQQQQDGRNYQRQPPQQQLHPMSHFPSASNASSQVPGSYYGDTQVPSNGSNSMATTMSDLSPGGGSATSFNAGVNVNPRASTLLNCDQQPHPHHMHHQQYLHELAPPTNTTIASYTSDYQSGYSAEDQHLHNPNVGAAIPTPIYRYDQRGANPPVGGNMTIAYPAAMYDPAMVQTINDNHMRPPSSMNVNVNNAGQLMRQTNLPQQRHSNQPDSGFHIL